MTGGLVSLAVRQFPSKSRFRLSRTASVRGTHVKRTEKTWTSRNQARDAATTTDAKVTPAESFGPTAPREVGGSVGRGR
jgi:hypothetical protein